MVEATRRLLAGVIDGIQSPAYLLETRKFPRKQGTDMQRIRDDVERVGKTFQAVMTREHDKQKKRTAA